MQDPSDMSQVRSPTLVRLVRRISRFRSWQSLRKVATTLPVLACLLGTTGSLGQESQLPHPVGIAIVEPYATAIRSLRWTRMPIPVCWVRLTASAAPHRLAVRRAVEGTWVRHGQGQVSFSGWDQECRPSFFGVRIDVSDELPHTRGFGRELADLPASTPGMVLNFTFGQQAMPPQCRGDLARCIRVHAVHEFGHALGFLHEASHPSAQGTCSLHADNRTPDLESPVFDPDSVMNSCDTRYAGQGDLSPIDRAYLLIMYDQ